MGYVHTPEPAPGCYPTCAIGMFPWDGVVGTVWECEACAAHWRMARRPRNGGFPLWVKIRDGDAKIHAERKRRNFIVNGVLPFSLVAIALLFLAFMF